MQYAIINEQITHIDEVEKGVKGICPVCKTEMIAKKGEIKQYFSHIINTEIDCEAKYKEMKKTMKEIVETKIDDSEFSKLYENPYNEDVPDVKGFTEEQLAVINATESRIIVNSISGSGKTSTLEEYIRTHSNEKILYLVFNKSMADESKERFDDVPNVEIRTIHSYAYQYFGKDYRNFLVNNINIYDVAKGINLFVKEPEEFEYVENLQEHFETYLLSEFHNVRDYCEANNLKNPFISDMNKLFDNSKNKKMKITHSFYYKLWHLSNPKFSQYDTLLIDEVNDINGALVDIVERNTTLNRIILVGDENQSLYKFAKCVNAFELLDKSKWKEYKLTNSFRIGNTLANIIQTSFAPHFNNFKIQGMNKSQKIVKEIDYDKPYFMICRYNATILFNVIENAITGKKIYIEGGKAGISFNFIKYLYEFKYHNKQHTSLKKFEDFDHLINYAEKTNDYEYKFALKLLREYGEGLLLKIRSAEENLVEDWKLADICYSSGHKVKGKSITMPIVISSDFRSMDDIVLDDKLREDEKITEKNLMYVCATRSKGDMQVPFQLRDLYLDNSGKEVEQNANQGL